MTIPIIFVLPSPSGEFVIGRQRRGYDHSVYPECTPAPWWWHFLCLPLAHEKAFYQRGILQAWLCLCSYNQCDGMADSSCLLSCNYHLILQEKKYDSCTCLMHPTWTGDLFHTWEYICFKCSGLVHGDDPEGWDGEGGERGVQDGEHR